MFNAEDVGVFLGMDVGKTAHHGHGLTPAGKKVFDKPMPNSEPKLRAVFDKLKTKFGTVLVIVDQPASIGALPLTVARDAGCEVAYLSGLAMRRIADLYPGEAKTDAKEAAVIADAARTMPHTLRSLELTDEITAELTVLTGFDQDLAAEATLTSNRIRGLLTPFPPPWNESWAHEKEKEQPHGQEGHAPCATTEGCCGTRLHCSRRDLRFHFTDRATTRRSPGFVPRASCALPRRPSLLRSRGTWPACAAGTPSSCRSCPGACGSRGNRRVPAKRCVFTQAGCM